MILNKRCHLKWGFFLTKDVLIIFHAKYGKSYIMFPILVFVF